jgi:hypothetical protein
VTSWTCPKCGKWHDLTACDVVALERFTQLLEAPAETADEASKAEDEALQRYIGRTRGEQTPG